MSCGSVNAGAYVEAPKRGSSRVNSCRFPTAIDSSIEKEARVDGYIVEIQEPLDCRPCGLHGYKACPLGHFHCAYRITDRQLLATLPR